MKFKKSEYYNQIKTAIKKELLTISKYKITLKYDKKMQTGKAYTYILEKNPKIINTRIGTDHNDTKELSPEEICILTYTVFHEIGHIYQYENCFSDANFLDMAICKAACIGNDDYRDRIYTKDLTEIDATYRGIENAYVFINEKYPDIDAEKELLKIFNRFEIMQYDYFTLGNGPFNSLDELLNSISRNYQFVSENGRYILPYKEEKISLHKRDDIFKYLDTAPKEMKEAWYKIRRNKDIELYLATVSYHRNELTRKTLPILKQVPYIASENYEKIIPTLLSTDIDKREIYINKFKKISSLPKEDHKDNKDITK